MLVISSNFLKIMLKGFLTALRTLTIIPLPNYGYDEERFDTALVFFPIVGVILGSITAFLCWGVLHLIHNSLITSLLALTINVWLTRALHIDGFADVIDAYYGSSDPQKRLSIMKDPHIGSFGVVAIVLLIMIKTICLSEICNYKEWFLIIIPMVVSRNMMVMLMVSLPYARPEGGKGEVYVKNAKPHHFIISLFITLLIALPAGTSGILMIAFAFLISILIKFWTKNAFGGVTGDILGFTNETIETLLFLLIAAKAFFYST